MNFKYLLLMNIFKDHPAGSLPRPPGAGIHPAACTGVTAPFRAPRQPVALETVMAP
jgi:hypothetical protein